MFTCCVILGQLLTLSVPQNPLCKMELGALPAPRSGGFCHGLLSRRQQGSCCVLRSSPRGSAWCGEPLILSPGAAAGERVRCGGEASRLQPGPGPTLGTEGSRLEGRGSPSSPLLSGCPSSRLASPAPEELGIARRVSCRPLREGQAMRREHFPCTGPGRHQGG